MATLYLVKGNGYWDEYKEIIRIFEDMEEKSKSYVGLGRRINKDKINKVQEGAQRGSYEIFVNDEDKIKEARKIVKERVVKYHREKYEDEKNILDSLEKHSLDSIIQYREY